MLLVRPLPPRAGHRQLFRARRPAVLRGLLPQPVLAAMRLLQRTHPRRKDAATAHGGSPLFFALHSPLRTYAFRYQHLEYWPI